MFKLVVIIERSKILREGISVLLRENRLAGKVVGLNHFDEWTVAMRGATPDLIIMSPDPAKESVEKIRSHYGQNIPVVGIVYQYYTTKEISELFDEAIYITDTEETFIHKFRNLHSLEINHSSDNDRLTEREKSVLICLLQGKSNKEVADQLSISPHTVVTHRKNIIEKTGIRSLSGLAVYAILNNIAGMEEISG